MALALTVARWKLQTHGCPPGTTRLAGSITQDSCSWSYHLSSHVTGKRNTNWRPLSPVLQSYLRMKPSKVTLVMFSKPHFTQFLDIDFQVQSDLCTGLCTQFMGRHPHGVGITAWSSWKGRLGALQHGKFQVHFHFSDGKFQVHFHFSDPMALPRPDLSESS